MMSKTHSDGAAGDSQALIAMLAEDAASRVSDHPEVGELVDYLQDALPPGTEARVQDHLVDCRACTSTVLDLEPLMNPGPRTAEGVADLEVAAAWRELKARAGVEQAPLRRGFSQHWVTAVAASFFVATLGLSSWVAQLRGTVSELSAPQVNYEVLYFESTRGFDEGILQVPEGLHRLPVFVTGVDSGVFADYEVVVLDQAGSEVWSVGGLKPTDLGSLRLEIPLQSLSPGAYGLRLYGRDGDQRDLVRELTGGFRHSE